MDETKEKLAFMKNIASIPGTKASPEIDLLLVELAANLKSKGETPGYVIYEDTGFETEENLRKYYTVFRNANPVPGSRCAHIFKCNLCDKHTRQFVNFKVHLRSHLGLLPYKCSICNKGFTKSSNCKLHLKNRTCTKMFR